MFVMLKLKSSIILIMLCGFAFTASAAKNEVPESFLTPPKPVESKFYDAVVGTWEGSTTIFGKKMHETLKAHWGLNHQFLIVDLKATGVGHKLQYEGIGYFGVDAQGKAKTLWLDIWGADAIGTGSGNMSMSMSESKLEIDDNNSRFKTKRTIELKGKDIVMNVTGTLTTPEGKEVPFNDTATYTRK
jgi:hypothetical protein